MASAAATSAGVRRWMVIHSRAHRREERVPMSACGRRECKARTAHSRVASCSPCLRPAIWRRRTASANRPDIEHSLRRECWQHLAAFFARVGVEVEEGSAGQTGLFTHPYALFSVTWRLSARLPVRREDYSTDLRQTGQRLEPGCSERRGRDGWLRRFCRTTPPWCLSPGLPVRREEYSTDLRQTGQRLEPGCSERRGRDG